MASSSSALLHLFFLLLSISFSIALKPVDPDSLILPITKDPHTHQYLTRIHLRTPHVPVSLVIDLGGRFLWLDCHSGYVSTTYRSVQCRSVQCSTAKSTHCGGAHHLSCPNKPGGGGGCAQNSCVLFPHNTITNTYSIAELVEDAVAVRSKDGSITTVDHFLFSCAPKFLLQNLAVGVEGMAGLGRNRIALPSQLASKLGFHRKFTVCLPSSSSSISNGYIFFGNGPYIDISKTLMSTPIVTDVTSNTEFDRSNEYYIGVKSIKVNGVRLSFNSSLISIDKSGFGGTKLSTIVPYTTLEASIYKSLTHAFIETASSTSFNMTRVASIAPFEVCFSSENIGEMRHGPAVPVIDLGLQSELVNWRIYGSNSMVRVNDEVMCLGFLNGGLNPRSSIVIGGYQMEDNLLEFDLGTSMLGFSSSLLIKDVKCSDFKFDDQESRGSL